MFKADDKIFTDLMDFRNYVVDNFWKIDFIEYHNKTSLRLNIIGKQMDLVDNFIKTALTRFDKGIK
jgi:hypothetical protein